MSIISMVYSHYKNWLFKILQTPKIHVENNTVTYQVINNTVPFGWNRCGTCCESNVMRFGSLPLTPILTSSRTPSLNWLYNYELQNKQA